MSNSSRSRLSQTLPVCHSMPHMHCVVMGCWNLGPRNDSLWTNSQLFIQTFLFGSRHVWINTVQICQDHVFPEFCSELINLPLIDKPTYNLQQIYYHILVLKKKYCLFHVGLFTKPVLGPCVPLWVKLAVVAASEQRYWLKNEWS